MNNYFKYLIVVIILALCARSSVLYLQANKIGNIDGHDYLNIAQSLSDGHGFSFRTDSENIVFKNFIINNLDDIPLYKPTAHRPPLVIWIYALLFKMGLNFVGIQIVQVLFSTATVALVYHTVVQLSQSTKRALLAGILLALNPYSTYLGSEIGTEWLFEFLIVLLIWQSVLMLKKLSSPIISGILFGLLILCRPEAALMLVISSLYVLFLSRHEWKRLILIPTCYAALIVSPWVIRSSLLFESFVPIATNGSQTLWVSWVRQQHFDPEKIHGGYYLAGDPELREKLKNCNEVQSAKVLQQDVWKRSISQPHFFKAVLWEHITDLFRTEGLRQHNPQLQKRLGSLLGFFNVMCSWYIKLIYLFALIAMFKNIFSRRLIIILMIPFILVHLVMVTHIRHRSAVLDAACAMAIALSFRNKQQDKTTNNSSKLSKDPT